MSSCVKTLCVTTTTKEYHKLNNVYCFCFVFPSIQAVAESSYYGTEIPLPCMRKLKTGPYFQ